MYLHFKLYCFISLIFTKPDNGRSDTLDKTIYKEMWYLEILLVRSCQYVSAFQCLLFYLTNHRL